jgi:hypothetical protein
MELFDLAYLWRSADAERVARGLTWAAVAREVGVAASTIRRFSEAPDGGAEGVPALVGWLGVAPEAFVADTRVRGSLLPPAGDGMIRVDMELVAMLSGWPRRANSYANDDPVDHGSNPT